MHDCTQPARGTAPDSAPCRLRWSLGAGDLARFAAQDGAFLVGDTLTLVASSRDSLEVIGAISVPMSRVEGTDRWILTMQAAGMRAARLGYRVMSSTTVGLPARNEWRGPSAPPPPLRARRVQGAVRADTLEFADGERREVLSYLPAGWARTTQRHVLYMGDGNAVRTVAALLDTLNTSGAIPPTAMVGIRPAPARTAEARFDRTLEYNFGFRGDSAKFVRHEQFLTGVVMPWAERTLGVPTGATNTAFWGGSNGGSLAIVMVRRHPELFGAALVASPSFDLIPDGPPGAHASYFLAAGSFEPRLEHAARQLADRLERAGNRVRYVRFLGGHDDMLWEEMLVEQLRWSFQR
ncbi:MAG: putative esterase [Gemmatimonadetes bacterium]|nr:putative esterase [Gemmatimonadota bacterium]